MPENLIQHRGQPTIWEGPGARAACCDAERWLTAALSGALLAAGLRRRRSVSGVLLAAGGGALAWWAASSREARVARRTRFRLLCVPQNGTRGDIVAESDEASFPASDPPGWTATSTHVE